jgi:hypothetical protein
MLGERSPWVRNIRAAGGAAAIKHGQRHDVHLVEVPADARAPLGPGPERIANALRARGLRRGTIRPTSPRWPAPQPAPRPPCPRAVGVAR